MKRMLAVDVITYDLIRLLNTLNKVKESWFNDINARGRGFDFKRQNMYASLYGDLLQVSDFLLEDKEPSQEILVKREKLWKELEVVLKDIVNLYEEYFDFFNSMDRYRLAIEGFRLHKPEVNNFTIEKIEEKYNQLTDWRFWTTETFEKFAYLETDFHFHTYFYAKNFLDELGRYPMDLVIFKNINEFKGHELVDMGLIDKLYKNDAFQVFEDLSKHDYYLQLNLLKNSNLLRIKKGYNQKAYFLIDQIYKTIPESFRAEWLPLILNKLKIRESNYKRAYRRISSTDASESDLNYAEQILEIIKDNK